MSGRWDDGGLPKVHRCTLCSNPIPEYRAGGLCVGCEYVTQNYKPRRAWEDVWLWFCLALPLLVIVVLILLGVSPV